MNKKITFALTILTIISFQYKKINAMENSRKEALESFSRSFRDDSIAGHLLPEDLILDQVEKVFYPHCFDSENYDYNLENLIEEQALQTNGYQTKLESNSDYAKLCHACIEGKIEIVNFYYKNSKYLFSLKNQKVVSPIFCACISGQIEILKFLYSQDKDFFNDLVFSKNGDFGQSLVNDICEKDLLETFKFLYSNEKEKLEKEILSTNNLSSNPAVIANLSGLINIIKFICENDKILLKKLFLNRDYYDILPFAYTCINGNLAIFELLYKNSKELLIELLNYNDVSDKISPFGALIKNKHLNILKFIIKNLSNEKENVEFFTKLIRQEGDSKNTPLHIAMHIGDFEIIKEILDNISNIAARELLLQENSSGCTPLYLACKTRNKQIISYILEKYGKKLFVEVSDHLQAIQEITESGDLELIFMFYNNGLIEKQTKVKDLKKILLFLFQAKNWEELKKYIEKTKSLSIDNLNQTNERGQTAFISACLFKQAEIAKLILEKNKSADVVNATDKENQSGLFFACINQMWETVELIIKNEFAKKSLNIVTKNTKLSPLCAACKRNAPVKIIELLFSKEVLNTPDLSNKTPIVHAIENKNYETIKFLLSNNAEINENLIKIDTPEEIKKLIKKSLELDNTIDYEISNLFEKNDINLTVLNRAICQNKKIETIFTLACQNGYWQIVENILKKTNKFINAKNQLNQTPLYFGCISKEWDYVKKLIKNGATKHVALTESVSNSSPLSLVCKENQTDLARFFIRCSNCAHILNIIDSAGKRPIDYAFENKNWQLIKDILITTAAKSFDLEKNDNDKKNIIIALNNQDKDKEKILLLFLSKCKFETLKNKIYDNKNAFELARDNGFTKVFSPKETRKKQLTSKEPSDQEADTCNIIQEIWPIKISEENGNFVINGLEAENIFKNKKQEECEEKEIEKETKYKNIIINRKQSSANGITSWKEPKNKFEAYALKTLLKNPVGQTLHRIKLVDKRWPAGKGWKKYEAVFFDLNSNNPELPELPELSEPIVIHFVKRKDGKKIECADFKFKTPEFEDYAQESAL